MKPKLKEDPREWFKFTAAAGIAAAIVIGILWRRGAVSPAVSWILLAATVSAVLCAFAKPPWFRWFYRTGMTVGFYLGEAVGRVLLILIYLLVITPLGLMLRLIGKDLLALKRGEDRSSYWRPAKASEEFDRLF